MADTVQKANSESSALQVFHNKIIIGSQVLKKFVSMYMLKYFYVFLWDYVDLNVDSEILAAAMKHDIPDERDQRKLFLKVKELFDREGIKFSLIYGSLLGAVREGGPIKGDNDMDICTWDEDSLIRKLTVFQREGLMLWRTCPGKTYSFTLDGSCVIDVYIMNELSGIRKLFWGKSCISIFVFETPRNLFTGWSEVEFMGEKVTCPENPERLLEFWYGQDWRIPQDKKGTYLVRSAYYYDRFISLFYRRPYFLYFEIAKVFRFLTNKEYRQKILQRKKETGSFFHSSAKKK